MTWSPKQYSRFEEDRTRPVRDLVAAIPEVPGAARMIDLGCGPGNSTEVLAGRFPHAAIAGMDSSPEMVAAARARLPGLAFDVGDIGSWQAGSFDVILSNAALQWLPDHAGLLPRLIGRLSAGGHLAVQMPDNLEEPAYRVMRAVADAPAWRGRLAEADGKRGEMETAERYYAILRECCGRVDIWRTTYFHVLAGVDEIVEWFKGSGLRPYLGALTEPERAAFLVQYRDGIAAAYPAQAGGTVLLRFPRLFFVATR